MTNEQTNTTDTPGTETSKPVEDAKPLSIVEEARAIRDDIQKQKEELIAERKKLEVVQSEALLNSTAGGHVETKPVKEVADKDYSQQALRGEIGDGKE